MKTILKTILKTIFTTVLAITMIPLAAQTSLTFDKIKLAGGAAIELVPGESNAITLQDGTTPAPSQLYSVNPDGWLTITGKASDKLKITANTINAIDIAGTGKIKTEGNFKVKDIELKVSGVGKLEMNLNVETVQCIISGAGKIELQGTGDRLDINISGSGKIDAEKFKVKECTATISGSGKCLVDVTEVLNSNISGSGSVYYINPPATNNKNISGVGIVGDGNENVKDTTKISLGKKKVLIVDGEGKSARLGFKDSSGVKADKVKGHWAGFELGMNMLVDKDFNTSPPNGYDFLDLKTEKSIAINFNLVDHEMKLYRRNIMLITGLGITFNNYRFKSGSYLATGTDSVIAVSNPDVNIKKNKLVASYLTVPLLLEFNTSENPERTVHLAVGVIGGLRLGSHVKIVQEVNGKESKAKFRNDFNLNPWRYDATVRLGFRNFTVFGSYGLANLFESKKRPEINPFTIGLKVIGW